MRALHRLNQLLLVFCLYGLFQPQASMAKSDDPGQFNMESPGIGMQMVSPVMDLPLWTAIHWGRRSGLSLDVEGGHDRTRSCFGKIVAA